MYDRNDPQLLIALQRRRSCYSCKPSTPERLCTSIIQALNPATVISKGSSNGKRTFIPRNTRFVQFEQLGQEYQVGPSVHQRVVRRPDELIFGIGSAKQRISHRRALREVERMAFVLVKIGPEFGLLYFRWQRTPITLYQSQFRVTIHDLRRTACSFQFERTPQYRVPACEIKQSLFE